VRSGYVSPAMCPLATRSGPYPTKITLRKRRWAFGRELPDEALDEATFATVDSLWQAFRDTAVPVA
ncbi:hypothetical protein ACWD48_33065, partial [Streptomyces sp. NPDC002519]